MKTTETIWHEYQTRLKVFITGRVKKDDVNDLLQDVFMKIHLHINTLQDNDKLESWLYQITRNVIVDYYRTKKFTEELTECPKNEKEEGIWLELSPCLEPILNQLPIKYRNAIHMSDIENRTQKEVAEHEAISLSGAKSRVQRGRALLKNVLHDCCKFEVNKHNQLISYEKKEPNHKYC